MTKFLLLLLCSVASNLLYAQSDTTGTKPASSVSNTIVDTAAMAKVYVIRSTGHVGSAVNLRLHVDSVIMCKVKNNRHAILYVEPGMHLFNATTWDSRGPTEKFGLKMPVEAGKTYYLSIKMKQRFMGLEITVEEVTYNTAAPQLEKYKQDECH